MFQFPKRAAECCYRFSATFSCFYSVPNKLREVLLAIVHFFHAAACNERRTVIVRFCIHRGSAQIGGSCVELDAQGYRILLDLGLPLDAESVNADLLPNVSGLQARDSSLLGIVLSHGHRHHWGLIPKASSVPLYMGKATERIMRAAAQFVPDSFAPQAAGHLSHGTQLSIGPFQVTPFLVDHSAFDAYALLVEAAGKRVLYSGDFRAHGRKGALVEQLIRPDNRRPTLMS